MINISTNYAIVYCRVFAMLLIVYYHSICLYAGTWEVFSQEHIEPYHTLAMILNDIHLPIFVFLSGLLYCYGVNKGRYTNTMSFINKKLLRLIIPYMFWGVGMILVFPSWYKPYDLFIGIGHLWFLMMLFLVFLIMAFVHKIWLRVPMYGQMLIILFFFVFSRLVWNLGIDVSWENDYLTYLLVLTYIPIFLWGMTVASNNLYDKLKNWTLPQLLIVLIISFLLIVIINIVNPPLKVIYYSIPICMLLLFLYTIVWKRWGAIIPSKILTNLNDYSMGIYIIHHILIWWLIDNLGAAVLSHDIIAHFVIFIVSLAVSYCVCSLFMRFRYTKYLIGS